MGLDRVVDDLVVDASAGGAGAAVAVIGHVHAVGSGSGRQEGHSGSRTGSGLLHVVADAAAAAR